MVNKDKPQSWPLYKVSLCKSCWATCCTMPLEVRIEDLVQLGWLSESDIEGASRQQLQKWAKQWQKQGLIKNYRESTGLFLMATTASGECSFLDSDRRCRVYDRRPQVCRSFPTQMGPRLNHCPYKRI